MKQLLVGSLAMLLFCGTEGLTCHEHELPVQLVSFQAQRISMHDVRLTWATATETNNYGFYVRRNGVIIQDSFTPGHGTTTEPQNYEWIDHRATSYDTLVYWLWQVDLDGISHLSDSIVVPRTFTPRHY